MNEDIKQLIEKECEAQKDIHWNDFGERADSASRLFDEAFAKGFNSCLSKWQDAERWRKVEEELPPMLIDVLFKVHVYAENYQSQSYTVGHLDSGCFHFQRSDADIIKIEPEEWKPIND